MSTVKFYVVPAVLYALVASPGMYKATRNVFGSWVSTSEGTAKIGGLILHAIVFILLATLAMRFFPSKRTAFSHTAAIDQQEGMNTKPVEAHMIIDAAPY